MKRVHLHQASTTRNAKGTALRRRKNGEGGGTHVQREKMAMNMYLSIIILNRNGLNAPIKRHREAKWIRKLDHIYAVSRDPPQNKRSNRLKVKGWKKYSKQMDMEI